MAVLFFRLLCPSPIVPELTVMVPEDQIDAEQGYECLNGVEMS